MAGEFKVKNGLIINSIEATTENYDAFLVSNDDNKVFKKTAAEVVLELGALTVLPDHDLDFHEDVVITTPASGEVLSYNGTNWVNSAPPTGGGGTVTEVDASVPTGFVVSGVPFTTSDTIAIDFANNYSLPNNTVQAEWTTAYNNSITDISFDALTGELTLTQQDTDELSTNLDGRYYLDSNPDGYTTNEGTVTSVALTLPTGLVVTGSPIIDEGILEVEFDTGYSIPTDVLQGQWSTAYSWGDHDGLYDLLGTAEGLIATHESTYNHANYDTAFGWGDHSVEGYLLELPEHYLDFHEDVTITNIQDGQVLAWDDTTSQFVNIDPPSGGASLAFKTISVNSSVNIVADATDDTLNLNEGFGIDLTANDTTDTLTIAVDNSSLLQTFALDVSRAEGGDLGTGSDYTYTFRMPYNFYVTEFRIYVTKAPTGADIEVSIIDVDSTNDIVDSSDPLKIPNGEKTSVGNTYTILTNSFSDDQEIKLSVTQVGSGDTGSGLKWHIIGYKLN